MADLDRQTEEALGWAAEGKKLAVDIPEVSFKDAATFVAEMTPIVGDAMAAKDVYDELQKDEPNYYLAGALGGAALVGLVPGLGDAAAKAIKKGAKEVFDVAKRVEVDPNAMGSGLGNVRLKPKQDDVAEAAAILDSDEALSAWQQANKIPENKRQANTEAAKAAAEDLYQGNITSKEARNIIQEDLPITSMYTAETMPDMPTVSQVAGSLGKKVQKTGVVGVKGFDIPAGTRVGSRLDIPAYNNYDTWVVSIHEGKNDTKGSVLGYGQAVRLKNIKFGSESQDALDIARGRARLRGAKAGTDAPEKPMGKATIARVYGDYVPEDPYALQEQARKLLSDPEWTQVGMNPYRQSNFYDKNTGLPVFEADEVIQVGPLVLARGVKKPTKTQLKELAVRTKDGKLRLFNEGGAVMDEPMEASLGDANERIDPVSGNEVPIGSTPEEVRDDIPAMLSENEYVVPADVVRYYGVKFFEDLRNEAKTGFKEMQANGRIGGEPVGDTGMEMGGDDLPFDISELQMIDDDSEEQPEMNKGGYISGYAEGGMSVLPYNPALGSIFGTSSASGGTGSGFEIRTYVGPSGQKLYLQFLNGEPLSPIPEGYTLESGTSEQVSEQVSTTATTGSAASTVGAGQYTPTSGSDNDDGPINMPKPKKAVDWTNPEEATPDKFLETYNQMTGTGATVMKYAMGAVGGPLFGLGIKGAEKLQINSMISGIDSQIAAAKAAGKDTTNLIEIKNVIEGKNRDGTARADAGVSDVALSGATYKNNSFSESLANLFTPDDGASYVNGQLVDDNTGKPIQPGGMTDSGRKIAGWANDPENDIVTEEAKAAAAAQKTPAAFATTTKLPKIDPTREATISYNPKGTNTTYMELANSLTPGDGRSYIGGQLIDEKTQEAYVPPKKDTVTTASGQAVKINTESTKEGTVGAVVGGQYAGDGFEWKKAENGNYMTRTYTGTNEGATGSNSTSTSTSSSSQGSACFLTTAIVERRGEKDDGPTLTKLRKFRDTYLVTMPHEVEEYYNVAPKIVAAIPDTHSDWSWIGSQIDKSIGFIDKDLPNEAYKTYKSMVIKLKKDWI